MGIRSIETALIEGGFVSREEMLEARKETLKSGISLLDAIIKLEIITEEKLAQAIALEDKLPLVNIKDYIIDQEAIKLVPEEIATRHNLIPLFLIDNTLTIAMASPGDVVAIDKVREVAKGVDIEIVVAKKSDIQQAIADYYKVKGKIEELIKTVDVKKLSEGFGGEEETQPIVMKLVDLILTQAVKTRASDVHIEPDESELRIRYRVDGVMEEVALVPIELSPFITSRIKVLSSLDITEKRLAQDGRFSFKVGVKEIDARVSTYPTIFGENIVIRLLDKSTSLLKLERLGFSLKTQKQFEALIRRPYGIILITGPTGSGKTTTLYAVLGELNQPSKNIITIEDPVEYHIKGLRQSQVNPKIGHTFAAGLRTILRQAPDIIMVGEIRDRETAHLAIEAALTGHLVLSTLHTNDASGAIARLLDMGIEPYLISSSCIGVVAQRLVRTICVDCKMEDDIPLSLRQQLGLKKGEILYKGKGCVVCNGSGYKGRIGIFELLLIDEKIKSLIASKSTSDQIKEIALQNGMSSLTEEALKKVRQGLTTVEEMLRLTIE